MYEEQRSDDMTCFDVPGAELVFPNFSGAEKTWEGTVINREGDRNFGLKISNLNDAVLMYNDGWNIQVRAKSAEDRLAIKKGRTLLEKIDILKDRGTLENALFFLKVNVSFKIQKYAPKVFIAKTAGGDKRLVPLDEDTIYQLDAADIINFDCTIRAKHYQNPGKEGLSAYLQEAIVVIREAAYKAKYSDYDIVD